MTIGGYTILLFKVELRLSICSAKNEITKEKMETEFVNKEKSYVRLDEFETKLKLYL
jgi:hypothetical protein